MDDAAILDHAIERFTKRLRRIRKEIRRAQDSDRQLELAAMMTAATMAMDGLWQEYRHPHLGMPSRLIDPSRN